MTFKNKVTTSTIFVYFLLTLVFVTIRLCNAFGLFAFMGNWAEYVFNIVVQVGLMLVGTIFLFSALTKKKPKSVVNFYGYKKISLKSMFISIAIGACVYVLNIFIASFFAIILQIFGYKYSPSVESSSFPFHMLIVSVIFTAILPAVCEETAHRGMVLKGLSSAGKMKALVISSILFGLMHMNIEQFFYATIIGFFVGYLAIVCDSIYPAMIIHFMNNFLNVYFSFSQANGLPLGKVHGAIISVIYNNFLLGGVMVVLLSFLLIMAVLALIKKLKKENNKFALKRLQGEVVKEIVHNDYLHRVEQVHFDLTGEKTQTAIEEEEMLDKKLGFICDIDEDLYADKNQGKLSILSKILLVSTFVLLSAVTIFTFVWGLL